MTQVEPSAASERIRPRSHPWKNPSRAGPMARRTPSNALDRAAAVLWPWPEDAYPGLWRGAAALLGCSPWTVRNWRVGKRSPPQWALDRILAELRSQVAARLAAIAELEKEKGRG